MAEGEVDPYDIYEMKEKCDNWVNTLEKAVKDKSIPEELYNAIKFYIIEQVMYDHRKLI